MYKAMRVFPLSYYRHIRNGVKFYRPYLAITGLAVNIDKVNILSAKVNQTYLFNE